MFVQNRSDLWCVQNRQGCHVLTMMRPQKRLGEVIDRIIFVQNRPDLCFVQNLQGCHVLTMMRSRNRLDTGVFSHAGHTVRSRGDSLLFEFASVVAAAGTAVLCARMTTCNHNRSNACG